MMMLPSSSPEAAIIPNQPTRGCSLQATQAGEVLTEEFSCGRYHAEAEASAHVSGQAGRPPHA